MVRTNLSYIRQNDPYYFISIPYLEEWKNVLVSFHYYRIDEFIEGTGAPIVSIIQSRTTINNV